MHHGTGMMIPTTRLRVHVVSFFEFAENAYEHALGSRAVARGGQRVGRPWTTPHVEAKPARRRRWHAGPAPELTAQVVRPTALPRRWTAPRECGLGFRRCPRKETGWTRWFTIGTESRTSDIVSALTASPHPRLAGLKDQAGLFSGARHGRDPDIPGSTDLPAKARHTILFLAAKPLGTDQLVLDREARAIQDE
jgi:hypothetical protein